MTAIRAGIAFALAMCASLFAQLPAAPLQFEVASIKRNTSGQFGSGPPVLPSGEVRFVNVPVRTLILRAYTSVTPPSEIDGLPPWADTDRYDVIAKGKPRASAPEMEQMWRTLLADRMKLAAHYDTREKPAYDLVFARDDHRLGDGLKPSTLDCSQQSDQSVPPAPGADFRAAVLSRCNSFLIDRDGTMRSGGITMSSLVQMITGTAGRQVIDGTGLDGVYAVTIRFQRVPPRADAAPSPDDPPSLFTALPEQLGLKLVSTKADATVLIVDRIERPESD